MIRSIAAALVLVASVSAAQDAGVAVPSTGPALTPSSDTESLRKELEATRRELKELRDEMHSQASSQAATQGWQEEWSDDKRKLELVTIDGYFRVRPELFHRFDLKRPADPAGYTLWPTSPTSAAERTNAGVNMRLRFEPTINVSEDVRVRAQIDALDNIVWGSTPDYAFSRNAGNGYWYDRNEFSVFSGSQTTPRSGINSLTDSISVRRVWGEVATPIGILRFGRMGNHWGLGMLHNDGNGTGPINGSNNGVDTDFGDTVDRVSFTAQPLSGFYITPALDFNVEGLLSPRNLEGGQQYDASNSDDSHSFIISAARLDTETERRNKLANDQTVFNYGLHFTYRVQRNDSVDVLSAPFDSLTSITTDGTAPKTAARQFVRRDAYLFMPDLWAKLERKNWRIEAEFAAIMGTMANRALSSTGGLTPGMNEKLDIWQFAAVVQGEYKLLDGALELGGEIGFASGDSSPGFGNYPRRAGSGPNGVAGPGDIDGPQYCLSRANCSNVRGQNITDSTLRAFRFNRDYRNDLILYRELLGGITDSFYVKPRASYRIVQGFTAFASVLYARAIYASSTPSGGGVFADPNLGIEINGGARYETEDGFFAQLQYGILFPLGGFAMDSTALPGTPVSLDFAQALRGSLGIKF